MSLKLHPNLNPNPLDPNPLDLDPDPLDLNPDPLDLVPDPLLFALDQVLDLDLHHQPAQILLKVALIQL